MYVYSIPVYNVYNENIVCIRYSVYRVLRLYSGLNSYTILLTHPIYTLPNIYYTILQICGSIQCV